MTRGLEDSNRKNRLVSLVVAVSFRRVFGLVMGLYAYAQYIVSS